MSKWKVVHEHESDSGYVRVSQNENGNVKVDSYMGNHRDPDNHDRLTLNTEEEKLYYHGYYHDNENDKDDYSKKY